MEQSDYLNPKKRAAIGKISGCVGILCNFVLAISKIIIGTLSGSMSVTADGVNNLSDAGSSLVTLVGFKLAEKPADREHPYGHARYEYLSSLAVSTMIFVVGFELAKESVKKIIHPTPVEYSVTVLIVLIMSMLVKTGMAIYNKTMGKRIQSDVLAATAADSRNDVVTTGAVLAATLIEHFTEWKVDGIMGVLVSVFIIFSGNSIAKQAISTLLGRKANSELSTKIKEYVNSNPMVLGCHDLMIHDYGPGRCYASIHVEMDKDVDTMLCHEAIDEMECGCMDRFNTHLVIHYDPVITDDEEINRIHQKVRNILSKYDAGISIHDFRMLRCVGYIKLVFDAAIPESLCGKEDDIRTFLERNLRQSEQNEYTVDIRFDLSDAD